VKTKRMITTIIISIIIMINNNENTFQTSYYLQVKKIPILKYPRHKKLFLSTLSSSSYRICLDIMVTTTNTNTTIIIITLISIFHRNWYKQGRGK